VISKVSIFGDKAAIKQNKFGVWQFRMWISSEKKYVEKSLRTKKKTDAVDLAGELYMKLRNELANGKSLFAPTYAEAMQQYIAYKQREVDVNALTDGRGGLGNSVCGPYDKPSRGRDVWQGRSTQTASTGMSWTS